jgi:hypothetical protein
VIILTANTDAEADIMRLFDRFRRKSPSEPQTGTFLLFVLGSKGLVATATEIGDAADRATQRRLEVKMVLPEVLATLGPNWELCNVQIECIGLDEYRLNVSALLVDGAGNWGGSAPLSVVADRARCYIAATELARVKGMPDRGMKPGDKAWLA